jgi:1-deoxy-D-xylulose-5-phosphate synthase
MSLIVPADENECRQALYTAFCHDGPTAVRYPRGAGIGVKIEPAMTAIPFGRGEVRRRGRRIAILAFGTLLHPALAAAERLDATVANMRFVKPLDVALVTELAQSHAAIVTIEEGSVMGGAGAAVLEALAAAQIKTPVLNLGLPDQFIEHGDPARLLALCGLDATGIEQSIRQRFGTPPALMLAAAS